MFTWNIILRFYTDFSCNGYLGFEVFVELLFEICEYLSLLNFHKKGINAQDKIKHTTPKSTVPILFITFSPFG